MLALNFGWSLAVLLGSAATGQVVSDTDPAQAPPDESRLAGPAADCPTIPALTPVTLEILASLGSRSSKSGDRFPIRLAAPIVIDGQQAVAAGAPGQGEVVHAKRGGGSGAPGELVLAARYLEVDGRRLPLRSMRIAEVGRDNIHAVDALAVASAASPVPVSVLGFFITGGETTVGEQTMASAKTASEFGCSAEAEPIRETTPPAKTTQSTEGGE